MENSTSQNAALKARFIPEPLQFHYCHHPGWVALSALVPEYDWTPGAMPQAGMRGRPWR